jgi:hypothetical protein
MYNRIALAGILAVILSALAASSVLGAGKARPGLWTQTVTVNLGEAAPKASPQAEAMLKARGFAFPDLSAPRTIQICITPEQAAMDRPPMTPQQREEQTGCTEEHLQTTADTGSADLVCSDERMQATIHIEVQYTGMTHYQGSSILVGTVGGRPTNAVSTFSGDFVSADCGSVKPLD